jgi:pathogenesis-related protein 1
MPRLRTLAAAVLLPASWIAACSGGSGSAGPTTGGVGGGAPSDTEPTAVAGITAAHNAARAAAMPPASPDLPPFEWSGEVAAVAQTYAEKCTFQHSGGMYGENLYATSGSSTPAEVVKSWVSESANYDYATDTCKAVCGHYTQVVWRGSAHLGCGVANCMDNSPFGGGAWQFWVCNYDPAGNFVGQKPY